MVRYDWIVTGGLLLAMAISSFAEEPTTFEEYVEMGVGYTNIALSTEVLRKDDLERWAKILEASDAQLEFMRNTFESFVTDHNSVMEREVSRHLDLSVAATEIREEHGSQSWEFIKSLEAVRRSSDRVRLQLERVEHRYINSLIPVLSEDQVNRLEILRREATRRQNRTFPNRIRWADVELRQVWEQVDTKLITRVEERAVQRILFEYEADLTARVRRERETFWAGMNELSQILAESHHGIIAPSEHRRRHKQILVRNAEVSQSVASLNLRTVDAMTNVVSDEVADAFKATARAMVFPELYPDPMALQPLFDALLDDADLTEESHEAIVVCADIYASEYAQLCDELEELCVTWGINSVKGKPGYEPQFLSRALEPVLEKRKSLSRETLIELEQAVGPDLLQRHAKLIPAEFELAYAAESDAN